VKRVRDPRNALWALVWMVGLGLCLLMVLGLFAGPAKAAAPAHLRIPAVAVTYRLAIEREAARNFGLDAPVARLAAQIHQESAWNPRAASAYAHGLTQFTPATARWLPEVCPAVGTPDPWDPQWALRAQACYMAWLLDRVPRYRYAGAMTSCTRWVYAMRAYNGGEGWLNKERLAAQRAGADANDWLAVEPYRVRAGWAHKENTHYPRRILLALEPAYLRAGWAGKAVC
jgi:soluble lytic murein transglycosylase-like protein